MTSSVTLKGYQTGALKTLRDFLDVACRTGNAKAAFIALTNRPYIEPLQLPGLPYVCLRVPTGGGKTFMAAHTVGVAADAFLLVDNPVVLWLVPSQAIRDQTLKTLKSREHPNCGALRDRFGDNFRVMTLAEALYAKRADYDGSACIIVATIQAFRVEDKEGRKVYDANGELMDHFTGLPGEVVPMLQPGPSGAPVPSLANVLRLRRPVVIVDEAHNVRSPLSFDTLAGLRPSMIVEYTATPVLESVPAKGIFASNVLHHVSAAELKAEEMVKLPIILRGRPDPRETMSDAIGWLDELAGYAEDERRETGEFIRPIMLLQAEARSKDRPTLHVDEVKRLLREDFRIPEDEIKIATGEKFELDGIDLGAADCRVRYIVTQQALKEGWDCPFAYVLCSVAHQQSGRAVEQLLGRVLRLPGTRWKKRVELNQAYAFATTTAFQEAALALRDGLVQNGFERIEAESLVHAPQQLPGLEIGGIAFEHEEPLPEGVEPEAFKQVVESAMAGRVTVDLMRGTIKVRGALSNLDRTTMQLAAPKAAAAIDALVHKTRGARLAAPPAAAERPSFVVPRLAVRRGDTLELFDRTHFLDIPWKLEQCDAAPVLERFSALSRAAEEARLDVSRAGQVTVNFVTSLQDQLALTLEERGWTKISLVNWLDRRLPNSARTDVTRTSSALFIGKVLDALAGRGVALEVAARGKYRLVEALVRAIAAHRTVRETEAYQRALMPQSGLDFATSSDVGLTFDENRYGYNQPYRGPVQFQKHFCRVVGDLEETGEEHECAIYLDRLPEVRTWIRNTSRQPHSFWLQTSTDRFYPDFVCLLTDGRVLVVEYKGSDRSTAEDAIEKDFIGRLWADRSGGKGLFIMVDNREFHRIATHVR
jgi:type III restriction enzyme